MAGTLGNILSSRWRSGSESRSVHEHKHDHEKGGSENDVWTDHWTDNDIRGSYNYNQYADSPISDSTTLVNSSPELDILNKKEIYDYGSTKPQPNNKGTATLNIPLPWFKRSRRRSGSVDEATDEVSTMTWSNITSPIDGISHLQSPAHASSVSPQVLQSRFPRPNHQTFSSKGQTHPQHINPTFHSPPTLMSTLSPVCENFAPDARKPTQQGKRSMVSPPLSGSNHGNRTGRSLPNSRVQAAGLNVYTDYSSIKGNGKAERRKSASLTSPIGLTDDDTDYTDSVPNSACSEHSTTSEVSSRSSSRARSCTRTPAYESEDEDEAETPRGRSANRSMSASRTGCESCEGVKTNKQDDSHVIPISQGRSASVDCRSTNSSKALTLEDLSHMRIRSRSRTTAGHHQLSSHKSQGVSIRAGSREPIRRERTTESASRRAISVDPLTQKNVLHPQWSPELNVLSQPKNFDHLSLETSPALVKQSPACPDIGHESKSDNDVKGIFQEVDKHDRQLLPSNHNVTDTKGIGLYTEISNQYRDIGRMIESTQSTLQPITRDTENNEKISRRSWHSNITTPLLVPLPSNSTNVPVDNQFNEDITSPRIGGGEKKRGVKIFSPTLKRDKKLVPNEEDLWG